MKKLFRVTDPKICDLSSPVDTRRRFNVYTTSLRRRRRRIDVVCLLNGHLDYLDYLDYSFVSIRT